MTRIYRLIFRPDEDEQAEADRQTASLAAMAFVLFLVVVGLFLIRTLSAADALQNCVLSGRHDCNLILANNS